MLKIPKEIQQQIHDKFVNKIASRCDETKYLNHSETIDVYDIKYVVEVSIDINCYSKFVHPDPIEQKKGREMTVNCYSYTISLLNSDMDDVIDCPLKKELENDIKNYYK